MKTKAECRAEAIELVHRRRHAALAAADQTREKLLLENPDFAHIEHSLIALSREKLVAAATGRGGEDVAARREVLQKKRAETLRRAGYTEEDLRPRFSCTLCDDTGQVNGAVCRCVQTIENRAMLRQLCEQLPAGQFTFDNFSLDVYESKEEKAQMQQVLTACRRYAEEFGEGADNLYLLGGTGLGKTHLSFAIARAVAAAGRFVIYCPSQSMIDELEKEHFGHTDESLSESYLTCELLILDDLGTEYLSPVALSSLYTVLNGRILRRLPTVINANLTPRELEKRYGERLASRIFGCYRTLRFVGRDVRILRRMASKKM